MPVGKMTFETEIDTKKFEAQIKELEKKLEVMVKTLENESKIPVRFRMSEDEKLKLEADIEKIKNKIYSLRESMIETEKTGNNMTDSLSKGFKKGRNSLKRFALSLFSIASIYSSVSRASSAYLSQDIELANKLQSVWTGLGSFLAPLLNWLSEILLKGVGYLNVFIKALTGIDYVARANAKGLNKQTGAQKKLNKQLAQFDEINKISKEDQGGVSAGGTSGTIDIPELDDRIVKKLQKMAYWLKENWYWIKKVGEVLLITFGAIKIAKLIGNIAKLIGFGGTATAAGAGLMGLVSALAVIASIGVITFVVKGVYDDIKELHSTIASIRRNGKVAYSESLKNAKDYNEILDLTTTKLDLNGNLLKTTTKQEYIRTGQAREYYDLLKDSVFQNFLGLGRMQQINETQKMNNEELQKYYQWLVDCWKQNEQIIKALEEAGYDTTQLRKYQSEFKVEVDKTQASLKGVDGIVKGVETKTSKSKDNVKETAKGLEKLNNRKLDDKSLKINIDADTSKAEKKSEGFFTKLFKNMNLSLFAKGFKIKGLATGGIVNNPGHGVPIGNVITGESGREGVIPLTDPRAMSELGAEIGKWITINNAIDVNMDSRRINRILATSKNNELYNKGGVI